MLPITHEQQFIKFKIQLQFKSNHSYSFIWSLIKHKSHNNPEKEGKLDMNVPKVTGNFLLLVPDDAPIVFLELGELTFELGELNPELGELTFELGELNLELGESDVG